MTHVNADTITNKIWEFVLYCEEKTMQPVKVATWTHPVEQGPKRYTLLMRASYIFTPAQLDLVSSEYQKLMRAVKVTPRSPVRRSDHRFIFEFGRFTKLRARHIAEGLDGRHWDRGGASFVDYHNIL